MVLVVGATGQLGSAICRELRRAGKHVRAVVRPTSDSVTVEALRAMGADTVHADVKEPATLRAACQGVASVVMTATATLRDPAADSITDVDHRGGLNLVAAAQGAGVKHFLYVSFPEAADLTPPSPLSAAKRAVEAALRGGRMPYMLLWPAVFMEVWLSPALGFNPVGASARVPGDGTQPIAWVSRDDVARVAAAGLDHPEWCGPALTVVAENLSMNAVVQVFEEAGGRPSACSACRWRSCMPSR